MNSFLRNTLFSGVFQFFTHLEAGEDALTLVPAKSWSCQGLLQLFATSCSSGVTVWHGSIFSPQWPCNSVQQMPSTRIWGEVRGNSWSRTQKLAEDHFTQDHCDFRGNCVLLLAWSLKSCNINLRERQCGLQSDFAVHQMFLMRQMVLE